MTKMGEEMLRRSNRLATEQDRTDAFEELCGGVANSQRLFQIWKDCWPPNKIASFQKRAKNEGYTDQQIDALLNLQ
jgi:hypothetical protein